MKFIPAVESCLVKYLKCSGRAPRSEYWWWTLFIVIVSIVVKILDIAVLHVDTSNPGAIYPLSLAWSLGTLIPSVNVATRRLHDGNRSGWWQLLAFTIIGIIPLLIWYCSKGTAGENRFGPDPLASPPNSYASIFVLKGV